MLKSSFIYLSRILYILAEKKKQVFILVFLFILSSLLEAIGIGLIGPFIALATNPKIIHQNSWLKWTYSQFGFHSEVQFVILFGVATTLLLYFKSFSSFGIQRYIFQFGFGQQVDLRLKLMHTYLVVPYIFHLNRNTAVLIQNVITETYEFANGVLMPTLFSISNLTIVCALMLLLVKTNSVATISILGVTLPGFYLLYHFKDKVLQWGKKGSEASTEMIRIINHGLGGLKETRVIGCEYYFENQMAEQCNIFKETITNFNAFAILPRYILEALLFTFLICFTIISLLSNQSPQSLASTLGIFGMASFRLLPSISNLMQSFSGIRKHVYVVDKIYFDLKELEKVKVTKNLNYLTQTNNVVDSSICEKVISFKEQIILDSITYYYPNNSTSAIKDVSLTIQRGQSIGLIGKSGAGKTTLVDIILGLLTPERGDIKVDGISIGGELRSWQNLIGYIPQSIFLMDDTIERNIAFGIPDEQIDQRKLDKAIQAAQLTDLVNQLPNGVKTVVGERGIRFSGGQRQRIGIARALYYEREILVLDEATAALDYETETLVSEAIKSLSGTKTLIIIAHRLSTIEHCDCIYLIEKGQIVKSGSYREVILGEEIFH